MSGVRPARVIHRGHVRAEGILIPTDVAPEAVLGARLLSVFEPGSRAFRVPGGYVVLWERACSVDCSATPGAPLVRQAQVLASAPLRSAELAALGAPQGAVVVVSAGAASVLVLAPSDRLDLSSLLDVSSFERSSLDESLGAPRAEPRRPAPPVEMDVRAKLGVAAQDQAAARFVESLRAGPADRAGPPMTTGLASKLLWLVATVMALVRTWLQPKDGLAAKEPGSALVAPASQPSWLRGLWDAISRAIDQIVQRSGVARLLGRRHAEYLAQLLDLLDEANLDEALRHAIPLSQQLEHALRPKQSLSVPSRRDRLEISPHRALSPRSIALGPSLFDELKARYRRAFERLCAQGEFEKAAFVLAELLGADEEAVSFLERQGKLVLAAELAEARKLPPGLAVRQWFLAGDHARALRIARRHGAFADAVLRLERTHGDDAMMLRLMWAETLADSGAYAAAVEAVWPVKAARGLLRAWMDRAIDAGGVAGARMLARRFGLDGDVESTTREACLALFQSTDADAPPRIEAFSSAILEHPVPPTARGVVRAAARAVLGMPSNPARDALCTRLVEASGDAVLKADLAAARSPAPRTTLGARVRAHALCEVGLAREVNEDLAVIVGLAEKPRPLGLTSLDEAVGEAGILLGVLDGCGGNSSGLPAATIAARVVADTLRASSPQDRPRPDHVAAVLAQGVRAGSLAVYEDATSNPMHRGMGCTATFAVVAGRTLVVAQVGDTRAYLLRAGKLHQLTRDHSLMDDMIAAGRLRPEDAAGFPHQGVVSRAMGVSDKVEPDLYRMELHAHDLLLLSTDGVHAVATEQAIAVALQQGTTPEQACRALACAVESGGAPDNLAVVVAQFDGLPPGVSDVKPTRIDTADLLGFSRPLVCAAEPVAIDRGVQDVGGLPIFDAAVLPDGRMVLALGELGVRLLARDGRTLCQFAEPAHHLVVSDHGDRVIALAPRGEAWRLARIDLVGRRVRTWCDARFQHFARDFDGATWFVASATEVFAIDVLCAEWDALWSFDARVSGLRRSPASLCVLGAPSSLPRSEGLWLFDLPSLQLRRSVSLPDAGIEWERGSVNASGGMAAWHGDQAHPEGRARVLQGQAWREVPETMSGVPGPPELNDSWAVFPSLVEGQQVLHIANMPSARSRMSVTLRGASSVSARLQHDSLVLADDQGRVLVIALQNGEVVRDLRIG